MRGPLGPARTESVLRKESVFRQESVTRQEYSLNKNTCFVFLFKSIGSKAEAASVASNNYPSERSEHRMGQRSCRQPCWLDSCLGLPPPFAARSSGVINVKTPTTLSAIQLSMRCRRHRVCSVVFLLRCLFVPWRTVRCTARRRARRRPYSLRMFGGRLRLPPTNRSRLRRMWVLCNVSVAIAIRASLLLVTSVAASPTNSPPPRRLFTDVTTNNESALLRPCCSTVHTGDLRLRWLVCFEMMLSIVLLAPRCGF